MTDTFDNTLVEQYEANGFVRVGILSAEEALEGRSALEAAEAQLGPLHYIDKAHTVINSAYSLATDPRVLDVVETLIGPDILLYNTTYIIKEPGSTAFVAWHQDLTYWGLADDDAQVSMWLAMAPAPVESGCMSMIPGSHKNGRREHVEDTSDANILLLGQRIDSIDGQQSEPCPLEAGHASFHHGWTVHASGANTSADRRIGLNVQYLAPHNRPRAAGATATLVRGHDSFGYFDADPAPQADLDAEAILRWRELDAAMKAGFTNK